MRRVLTEGQAARCDSRHARGARSNEAARRFYEGLGFAVTATRPQHYYTNPVEDALILWRE